MKGDRVRSGATVGPGRRHCVGTEDQPARRIGRRLMQACLGRDDLPLSDRSAIESAARPATLTPLIVGRHSGLDRRHDDQVSGGRQPADSIHAAVVGNGRRPCKEAWCAADVMLREHAHVGADHRLAAFIDHASADAPRAPQRDVRPIEPLVFGERDRAHGGESRGLPISPVDVAQCGHGDPVRARPQPDERESPALVGHLTGRVGADAHNCAGDGLARRAAHDASDRTGWRILCSCRQGLLLADRMRGHCPECEKNENVAHGVGVPSGPGPAISSEAAPQTVPGSASLDNFV